MFERADLVQWRARYLRAIRQYRRAGRPIVYLDKTWFNTNDVPARVWQDITTLQDPHFARKAGSGLTLGLRAPTNKGASG